MEQKKISAHSILLVIASLCALALVFFAAQKLDVISFDIKQSDDAQTDMMRPMGGGYYYRIITIDEDHVALYDAPGTENRIIAFASAGQTFESEECADAADGVTWYKLDYKGRDAWIDRHLVSVENKYYIIHDRDFSEKEPVIYLSPSRQGKNAYCLGDTTEQEQMEALGKEIYDILSSEYRCKVYLASPKIPITDKRRSLDAKSKKADIYLAIHSNSESSSDEMAGAMAFYFPTCAQSRKLAENLVSSLGEIAPLPSTIEKQVRNGMKFTSGLGYAEVRDPSYFGMVAVLAETDFHDNPVTAQWIIDNRAEIARAYVEALVKTFDISGK